MEPNEKIVKCEHCNGTVDRDSVGVVPKMQTAREWHDDELKLERLTKCLEEIEYEAKRKAQEAPQTDAGTTTFLVYNARLIVAQELLKELKS